MLLKNLWIYIHETFKPLSVILTTVLLYFGNLFMFQILSGQKNLVVPSTALLTISCIVLLLLYWRIYDEFKDYDVDLKFFPDRPLPSGRVTFHDLEILMWAVSIILFGIHLFWRDMWIPFLAVYVFTWLIGKWFFIKKYLKSNRLLTFVTHCPIVTLINYYILSSYSSASGQGLNTGSFYFTIVWFSLFSFVWEFARKTRAPAEEEEGYQTYSTMLGYKVSTIVAIVFSTVSIGMLVAWQQALQIDRPMLIVFMLIYLVFGLITFIFITKPEKGSKLLHTATTVYITLTQVVLIGYYVYLCRGE